MHDDYTDPAKVVRIRLFEEKPGGDWSIDGVDENGHYTEACWSYATEAEARAAIPEFRQENGIPADVPDAPVDPRQS